MCLTRDGFNPCCKVVAVEKLVHSVVALALLALPHLQTGRDHEVVVFEGHGGDTPLVHGVVVQMPEADIQLNATPSLVRVATAIPCAPLQSHTQSSRPRHSAPHTLRGRIDSRSAGSGQALRHRRAGESDEGSEPLSTAALCTQSSGKLPWMVVMVEGVRLAFM